MMSYTAVGKKQPTTIYNVLYVSVVHATTNGINLSICKLCEF